MNADNRTVVHMDLDSFFVSVERLRDSRLNGKPIIVGGTSERGVVASCSYEARKFGVHSAMSSKLAKQLCPNAIFIKGDYESYSKYSKAINEIITEQAPLFQQASIDEFYLDITGMDKFFGCKKWSHELRQRIIKETGLPISLGLSVNKTVSKIATGEAKPNGELEVERNNVKPFLSPLSIQRIPMIGIKTFQTLSSMGISNIGVLSTVPVRKLVKTLGENGKTIWEKANGIDNTPIEPYQERKSISTEETFEKDTTDIVRLNEVIVEMVMKLAYQLRQENRVASTVSVKIRYSNFDTHNQQCRIGYTSSDHLILNKVKELFAKLYNRRLLIRLVGIRLSNLTSGCQQIHLFDDTEEKINLYQAMDAMRNRFGENAVLRAISLR